MASTQLVSIRVEHTHLSRIRSAARLTSAQNLSKRHYWSSRGARIYNAGHIYPYQALYPRLLRLKTCSSLPTPPHYAPSPPHGSSSRTASSWTPEDEDARRRSGRGRDECERDYKQHMREMKKEYIFLARIMREDREKGLEYLQHWVEKDPYRALFGVRGWGAWNPWTQSWLGFGNLWQKSSRERKSSDSQAYSGITSTKDKKTSAQHTKKQETSTHGQFSSNERKECNTARAQPVASYITLQEYAIDPITMKKVPKSQSETPNAKPPSASSSNAVTGERGNSCEIPVKKFQSTQPLSDLGKEEIEALKQRDEKPAKLSGFASQPWLMREGFKPNEKSPATGSSSKDSTTPTHDASKETIEPALNRMPFKGQGKQSRLDYNESENRTEDIDLLRASDVRAASGHQTRKDPETPRDTQQRREKLEQGFTEAGQKWMDEVKSIRNAPSISRHLNSSLHADQMKKLIEMITNLNNSQEALQTQLLRYIPLSKSEQEKEDVLASGSNVGVQSPRQVRQTRPEHGKYVRLDPMSTAMEPVRKTTLKGSRSEPEQGKKVESDSSSKEGKSIRELERIGKEDMNYFVYRPLINAPVEARLGAGAQHVKETSENQGGGQRETPKEKVGALQEAARDTRCLVFSEADRTMDERLRAEVKHVKETFATHEAGRRKPRMLDYKKPEVMKSSTETTNLETASEQSNESLSGNVGQESVSSTNEQLKERDRALLREIRDIYESQYGTISTTHKQPVADKVIMQGPSPVSASTSQSAHGSQHSVMYPERELEAEAIRQEDVVINEAESLKAQDPEITVEAMTHVMQEWPPNVDTKTGANTAPKSQEFQSQASSAALINQKQYPLPESSQSQDLDPKASSKNEADKPRPASKKGERTAETAQEVAVPYTYRILAMDRVKQTVMTATTSSSLMQTSSPLRSAQDILTHLDQPYKYFDHMGTLESQGFQLIGGTRNMLLYRRQVSEKSSPEAKPANNKESGTKPAPSPAKPKAEPEEEPDEVTQLARSLKPWREEPVFSGPATPEERLIRAVQRSNSSSPVSSVASEKIAEQDRLGDTVANLNSVKQAPPRRARGGRVVRDSEEEGRLGRGLRKFFQQLGTVSAALIVLYIVGLVADWREQGREKEKAEERERERERKKRAREGSWLGY